MIHRVYLDYNASTPMDPRVKAELLEKIDIYGNASSIHAEGREARALVDEARVSLGALLNCDHRQVVFTSGGTEANNLAVLGIARANSNRGRHLITSSIEHSSILNACRRLAKEGFEITYVNPSEGGVVDSDRIADAIRPDTILITVMMANNEIGTLQPIRQICDIAHAKGVPVHTDAIQALGKVPVDIKSLGVDLLSVSAHKIYGPKGVGALFYSPETLLQPLIFGGSHEKGLRAGTENAPSIHAFSVAAGILLREGLPDLMPVRAHLEAGLIDAGVKILCRDFPRLPNTVNFYLEEWLGESMVMAFDLMGISVSNGSACSAGVIEPSHVIQALGYNDTIARSVIRVSTGKFTQIRDIDYFLRVVHDLTKGRVTE